MLQFTSDYPLYFISTVNLVFDLQQSIFWAAVAVKAVIDVLLQSVEIQMLVLAGAPFYI